MHVLFTVLSKVILKYNHLLVMSLYAMPPVLSVISIVIISKVIISIVVAYLPIMLVMLGVASFIVMPNVVMLSIIMPSVVAPQFYLNRKAHFRNFCQF